VTPKPIPVKVGDLVVVVTDADLAVLNGLDIELERWCRSLERSWHEEVDPAVEGYPLTAGREHEKLSRYHPAGSYPRASLNALERAGLVKRGKLRGGTRWYVTAAGDELLQEREDELGPALCAHCWVEPSIPDLQVEGEPPRWSSVDQLCPSCALEVLTRVVRESDEDLERAEESAANARRYVAAVRDALEALPDD
jgi:hypothetical protein